MNTQTSLTQKSQWVEKYPTGYINFNKKNNTFKKSLLKNTVSIQNSIKMLENGDNVEEGVVEEDTIALTYENFSNKKEHLYSHIHSLWVIILILLSIYTIKKIFIIL